MRVALPVLFALLAPGLSGAAIALVEAEARQAPASRVGGQIKEPRKLKDVRPRYPEEAKQARVQGVVILECTISPKGQVTDVKVLRGVPLLDAAAVEAVRQWEYTPTLLNGVPVPVIMTVTVNFRLNGAPAIDKGPASGNAAMPTEREAELRRLVRALRFDLLGGRELDAFIEAQSKLQSGVPGELWETLRAEYPAKEFETAVLRIFDASLGPDDVRAATFFYESEVGGRLLEAQTRFALEAMAISAAWMERVLEELPERLKKDGSKTTP